MKMQRRIIQLYGEYAAEIDEADEESWYEAFSKFRDANIYQTWAYGNVRFGEANLSHIIVRRNEDIIGIVQTRIVKLPVVNAGIAYVRWGPLWRKRDIGDSSEDLRAIVVAMREEYVGRRGLYLRIIPHEISDRQGKLVKIFEFEGFEWTRSDYRTLYLPLSDPLDVIRSNLGRSWRRNLNNAEANALKIVQGTDRDLFKSVVQLYREMVLRKKFVSGMNIDEYLALQERLPEHMKMRIMVCYSEGCPVAGLVGSAIGGVGIELIAATGNDSLKMGASFLLRWKMVEYLQQCGCHFYNLNGINPEINPGGYMFKAGLSGKKGLDVEFLGSFEMCENEFSHLAVKSGEMAFEWCRRAKEAAPKFLVRDNTNIGN
jgi:hypothetical protein